MIRSHCRIAVVIAIVLCGTGASPSYAIEGGRYGNIKIVEPPDQPRGLVIFFSGRNGLRASDDSAAQTIAKAGALVAEVDTPVYLGNLDKLPEKCHQPVFDAEWFSRQIQRERAFPTYLTPILAGAGEGGTLAIMTLAYAPAATIDGVVALDPSATIISKNPLCSSARVEQGIHGFRYGVPKTLPGFCAIGLTARSKHSGDYVLNLKHGGAPFELHKVGINQSMGEALRALIEPHLAKPKEPLLKEHLSTEHLNDISSLPLTILGVGHPSNLMAIVISGDGGWRDLDKTIAENLQQQGVPVVGWDSLRYFWRKKTPRQTSDDLANVMQTYLEKWHAKDIALIGYSFGADVMPFAYNRLPEKLRSQVVLISLLGFSKSADFQITVSGWLGEPPGADAMPVLKEVDQIPPALMQCFYGHDEGDSACPELKRRGVQVFSTTGGHHFDGDYAALAGDIIARLKSASSQAPRFKQ